MLTKKRYWEILQSRQITVVTVAYNKNYSQFYFEKKKFRKTSHLAHIIQASENRNQKNF